MCRVLDGVMNDVQRRSPPRSHPLYPAPSPSPDRHDHPSPSRTRPLSRLQHLPRARAGSCTSRVTMTRILIICKMQKIKCPTGITPAASPRAAHTVRYTFRTCSCSSSDTDPWMRAKRCQLVAVGY